MPLLPTFSRVSACSLVVLFILLAAPLRASQVKEDYLVGADVSALTVHEKLGVAYRENGKEKDCLALLVSRGFNCFRLRLFVAPTQVETEVNDLDYTLALARRIKASGAKVLLDLHYSDTWADPAKQFKPDAWKKLSDEQLRDKVRDYTRATLLAFVKEGLAPDYVQIGNEITNGLLWPTGQVEFARPDDSAAWDRLAGLLKAGSQGLADAFANKGDVPKIILHIESTGNNARTSWWIRNAQDRQVPFDLLGFSFYPEWHGTPADLSSTLAAAAQLSGKPVLVTETAYPWKTDSHWKEAKQMNWPLTPQGQLAFLREVDAVVRSLPEGQGRGVFYWYPEAVQVYGLHTWVGGSCGLFDNRGEILPGANFALPAK